jgi:hypothetical protein
MTRTLASEGAENPYDCYFLCVLRGEYLVWRIIMTKNAIVAAAILILAGAVSAQTATHKRMSAARPNTNAPSKVTGDGIKTESGLQYWDIKEGLGSPPKRATM